MLLSAQIPAQAANVLVFAAASMRTALDEIAADWQARTGDTVTLSYAGSGALARQIIAGAPADIFLSASTDWMDAVEAEGLIVAGTRRDLLGNTLVLVGHGAGGRVAVSPALDLPGLLGDGWLAMALVDSVPAGQYGKAALQSLGLWDSVAARVAQTDNVRAALALVATGEAPLGIVYATDAVAEPAVSVLGRFPAETHPPIVFPVALLTEATDPADAAFLDALHGAAARAVFERNGFRVLDDRP
jgi:molybdate transport system substrate-binding protein